jgi:hypothetical protein
VNRTLNVIFQCMNLSGTSGTEQPRPYGQSGV